MFALHVYKFKYVALVGIIILMLSVVQCNDSAGGRHKQCELKLNIISEVMNKSINRTNDNYINVNNGDFIILRFYLINPLKENYNLITIKYNISSLYAFPSKKVKATSANKFDSNGFFNISFNRTGFTNSDYFEVNEKGLLILNCREFKYNEKINFSINTRISNNPKIVGEYKVSNLRYDHIILKPNKCSCTNQEENFQINNIGMLNVTSKPVLSSLGFNRSQIIKYNESLSDNTIKNKNNFYLLLFLIFALFIIMFIVISMIPLQNWNLRKKDENITPHIKLLAVYLFIIFVIYFYLKDVLISLAVNFIILIISHKKIKKYFI
jgi:hypothetical protein